MHVLDASRVVGVVGDLLDGDRRARLDAENRADQDRLRALHAEKGRKPLLPLREARTRRTPIDWHADDLAAPPFTGSRVVEEDIATLREYIDWTFFFHAWELKGRYPAILDDPEKGEVARDLFAAANELLDEIVGRRVAPGAGRLRLLARARGGRRRRRCDGGVRFPMLRQQADHADSRPNRSLADFVAPVETGLSDHVGAFAVAIHGGEALADRFAAELDDYRAIMVRALADRLAEAFAERLHEIARHEWYAPGESLSNEERIGERFRGIRPAYGYPACPDHSEKGTAPRPARGRARRHRAHGVVRDDARRERERPLLRPPAGALLLGRADRARPGRRLRRAEGHRPRRGRALAAPEPRVRAVMIRADSESSHGADLDREDP